MKNRKTKFVLWIAKILKVELPQPERRIIYDHQAISYKEIMVQKKFSDQEIREAKLNGCYNVVLDELKAEFEYQLISQDSEFVEIQAHNNEFDRTRVVRATMYVGVINQ